MNLRLSSSSALLALLLGAAMSASSVNSLVPSSMTTKSPPSPSQRSSSGTTSQLNVAAGLPMNGISSSSNNPNNELQVVNTNDQNDSKVGVLLLNLGGPEKTEDVEGFLFNLFADPDIIRLPSLLSPLQAAIALFISKRRAPKSREAYESIGGGSPILKYSNEQANLLSQRLKEEYDLPVKTYIGMRYWHPFTEEALAKIRGDGIEALVIVPLYPQFSISTSGSSLRVLQEEFSRNSNKYSDMVHTVVPSWYQRPGYVKAVTDLIRQELDSFTGEEIAEAKDAAPDKAPLHVLFSAHGVPQSYIQAGDPYQRQIEESVERITDELRKTHPEKNVEVHLSYQSRVGPIEWLRPYTDDVLPDLGDSGVRNLVVVPISFVSEHIETLEEIDIEYRELAQDHGVTNWRRSPALNTDPNFINDMADMVFEALNEPAQTVTEACVANNVDNVDLATPLDDDTVGVGATGVGGVGADTPLFATSSSSSTKGNTARRNMSPSPAIASRNRQQRLKLQSEANPPAQALRTAKAVAPMVVVGAAMVALSGPISAAQWPGM